MVVKKYYLSLFTLSPMILVPHNTKFPLDYLFFVTHKLDKPKNDLHFKGKQTPEVDRMHTLMKVLRTKNSRVYNFRENTLSNDSHFVLVSRLTSQPFLSLPRIMSI